jgi:hypothetical protein
VELGEPLRRRKFSRPIGLCGMIGCMRVSDPGNPHPRPLPLRGHSAADSCSEPIRCGNDIPVDLVDAALNNAQQARIESIT